MASNTRILIGFPTAFQTLLLMGLLCLAGCASPKVDPLAPVADLQPRVAMPDPLVMLDGTPVKTRDQWFHQRRPELQRLFEHYLYGAEPPKLGEVRPKVTARDAGFLQGTATLKVITLETGPAGAPKIDLLVVIPNALNAPAPVILAMNFCGNQAVLDDPRVPLPQGWVPGNCKGCSNNLATDASRGSQAQDWPVAEMMRRGYALATFFCGDVDKDRGDVSEGIYAFLAGGDPARNNPTNRGTIAAWAWGYSRCVDYLVKDSDIDSRRIAAFGHSRNGKTALLATALDERIGIAFAHQAGMGGSAPSRGKTGESVKAINDRFPHWFNAEFKKFNDAPEKLPMDQNCLVALCAPRAVLFTAAEGDQWANPAGQFVVLQAADPVYRFLGVQGLETAAMPPLLQLVGNRLGFYQREGKHSTRAADWTVFMNFADRQWRRGAEAAPR